MCEHTKEVTENYPYRRGIDFEPSALLECTYCAPHRICSTRRAPR